MHTAVFAQVLLAGLIAKCNDTVVVGGTEGTLLCPRNRFVFGQPRIPLDTSGMPRNRVSNLVSPWGTGSV